jgi:xeroderma pigmentosum group C-complementing protein
MLPIGCVWIKDILEPAIFSRTCKKLDIDCVKAVTGFDGKKGYPVTEGYVLCKEFEVI